MAATVGTTAALAAALLPAAASAASAAPATATSATAAPAGFLPASTSWTSPTEGWVLGFAPCRAGSCPALLSTSDDAQTWQQHTAPRVAETVDQTRVHFANGLDGWATDGQVLMATHDGAATWQRVRLLGAIGTVSVTTLASTDRYAYAIVASGTRNAMTTQLYSSPVGEDRWQPVEGVAVPGSGGWDIAASGSAAYVALGVVHESLRTWSSADGATWSEVPPMCPVDGATRVDIPRPGAVDSLCSFAPGRGFMTKVLVESADGGEPVVLGQAPDEGITTSFGTNPAGGKFVAAVGAGASWLHASFDGGATWETPLLIPDVQLPVSDLRFQDDTHGVVVWGGPAWEGAAVYRTTDGGHTWSPLTF